MTQRTTIQTIIPLALFIIVTLLMIYPSYTLLVEPRRQAFDWFPIWLGGRAILSGVDPYGLETTQRIHRGVYGQLPAAGDYLHGFSHPPHIAFVLAPFLVMPFQISVLIWLALQLPLFVVGLLLGLHLLGWSPSPGRLSLLILLTTLGFRYPMIVYVLGQLTFFVTVCGLLSIWLYQHGHPRLAAMVLAGTTIRPDLAIVAAIPATLWLWTAERRQEFLTSLVVIGLILALLPLPFLGFWPALWLDSLWGYGRANPNATWPPALLPNVSLRVALGVTVAIWLGRYIYWAGRETSRRQASFLLSATILATLMLLPQTGSYNLTMALISGVILLRYASSGWLRGLIILSLLTPWFYFALGESFSRLIFLLIPGQLMVLQELVSHSSPG